MPPHRSCPPLRLASRRQWLRAAGAIVGVAGGFTLPGARLAFAAGPDGASSGRRLVVVMLRGALDGLAAVPAVGDPAWTGLRPPTAAPAGAAAPLPLDATFALHPALPTLHRWYGAGHLLVAHAVATPYRQRSHFDAQHLLESGGARPFERDTGWIAPALQASGGQAVAMTPGLPVALRGAGGATSWAPSRAHAPDDDLLDRLGRVLAEDVALGDAFERAREQRRGAMGDGAAGRGAGFAALARQAGRFLAADHGPTVAWLEVSGWDTHTAQAARLARLLPALDDGLGALRESLAARWSQTVVLVVTEFGRSAAMNGSGGTDHGTAGVAWLAGGAVLGGRVRADWPGLGSRDLLDGRDLRPTQDLRGLFKAVVERHFDLASAVLEREVLPGAPRAWDGLWAA